MQPTVVTLAQAGFYEQPAQWTYVAVGYTLCIAGILGYVVSLRLRGRRLARQVPPDEQRWMPSGAGEERP
jgi:hypothetical protein